MSATEAVKKLQKDLKKLKMYNGEIDGQAGPLTANALYQFHTRDDPAKQILWLRWAINELGVSEIYGERDNPRIVYYHRFTSLAAKDDEVAWCSSFVNAALEVGAGIKGTGSAAAASFKKYGKPVSPATFGAILLYPTKTGSKRHVFFSLGVAGDYVLGLGGNQSNAVTIAYSPITKITESRFPLLS
jgi:uncharacterized protein (TIGR02594 family)